MVYYLILALDRQNPKIQWKKGFPLGSDAKCIQVILQLLGGCPGPLPMPDSLFRDKPGLL